jgi:dihydrolipoamide dehydrogenase
MTRHRDRAATADHLPPNLREAVESAAIEHRQTTVLIIGGGPCGYVAGIRCGQLGLETVVVDEQPMGGTCLNVGCIPSKALIHAADEWAAINDGAGLGRLGITAAPGSIDLAATVGWKDGIVERLNRGVGSLLAKAGTGTVNGRATVLDGKTCDVTNSEGSRVRYAAEHLVLATGSVPVALPGMPFGGSVVSSTGALSMTEVPPTLAVVGGGYIGVELGTAFAKLGSTVTIVEAEDRLLPQYDAALTRPVADRLAELGVTILTATMVSGLGAGGAIVEHEDGRRTIEAEKILVTVGRRPNTSGWGLDELALTMNGPFIDVDERGHTSMRDVWAIGDVTGEPMLAHRAMKQGETVAAAIAGHPARFDPLAIPAIVFSDPEIVTVGLDPGQAEERHGKTLVGRFPLSASSRSMTLDRSDGFVRVVARANDHVVVGIQAVGSSVAELSGAFGGAIEMGARLDDLAATIYAHPTIGEAFAEASEVALGSPLHI